MGSGFKIYKKESPFFYVWIHKTTKELLEEYGFVVQEYENDAEDIVFFEDFKRSVGMPFLEMNVKKEFSAEFCLTEITSIFVEGEYMRKPSGEKMYGSYYFSVYKRGFVNGRFLNEKTYLSKRKKIDFVKWFERNLKIFQRMDLGEIYQQKGV